MDLAAAINELINKQQFLEKELTIARSLIQEAPTYFSVEHDFEGRKSSWIAKAFPQTEQG